MKAVLKNGLTVEIDTKHLFHDQYNLYPDLNGRAERIFDGQIVRIIDDARPGMGRCRYCGKMIRRGEEEQHFTDEESKPCESCWWWQDKLIATDHGPAHESKTVEPDGKTVIRKIRTTVDVYEKHCSHKEQYGGCSNCEHRRLGIDWFTPENTFFLKNPNGFAPIQTDGLTKHGFNSISDWLAVFETKIGSYRLCAHLIKVEPGQEPKIDKFSIDNCRTNHTFRLENGEWYTWDHTFGYRAVKTLERVPFDVLQRVKKIVKEVKGE